jgi:hypothetical protein
VSLSSFVAVAPGKKQMRGGVKKKTAVFYFFRVRRLPGEMTLEAMRGCARANACTPSFLSLLLSILVAAPGGRNDGKRSLSQNG